MNGHRSFDYVYRRSRDRQRRQEQNQQQLLRAQWGFESHEKMTQRFTQPVACMGCANYFGRAYGYSRNTRSILVCAMYPDGWRESPHCPDWRPCLS